MRKDLDMDTFNARLRAAARREDGVAMMTVVMLTLILMSLSVLVLGMVVSQVAPAQFARKNTETVFAAEAGLETAMGRIRTAQAGGDFTGAVYGKPNLLPCTVEGVVGQPGSQTTYAATVRYYADDPTGKSPTWLNANKLACTPGSGTGTVLPSFAYIESAGDAPAAGKVGATQGDRAIAMVYRFETTTTNIKGGRIFSWFNGNEAQFCLRATNTTPGSTVTYRPIGECGAVSNDNVELWIYDTDYTLKLASSTLTATSLCMTNESGTVRLRACTASSTQAFAWHPDGNATWVAQNSSFQNNGTCLKSSQSSGVPSTGSTLQVGTCANQNAWGSFAPDPAVGPGAASISTKQIVNFLEFGRCFDVTDTNVGRPFMISYPCKQDPPSGAELFWNHKWYYEEPLVGTTAPPQLIYVYQNNDLSKDYCLQAPSSQTDPTESGVNAGYYPTLTASCSTSDPRQMWTRSTATGVKATSWTIRDNSGRCIGVGGSKYLDKWSALVVSACDGAAAQKWNAPADSVEAKVGGYLEEKG
ncbi:RICIN domain-containing protein [Cellulomonas sp. Sa3CUA2]|uniref:RICIN domain-containing protein n=1 Tax=Cellulomonas avistercoris TaxID=2762242 RepID=A0ABR8Q989_9CELL|nr:RICIN domain-containing protein [Cellulomonas avistercoris]MBD7916839.1 RICIN domain-containing protein [Cellulomonas avistercoris]